jgi:hypothetical protein
MPKCSLIFGSLEQIFYMNDIIGLWIKNILILCLRIYSKTDDTLNKCQIKDYKNAID